MLHSLCFHHLCWIVKQLLSSDHFFREAEPETTKNKWIVVGDIFLGWTLWLAFRALLYLFSFGVCKSLVTIKLPEKPISLAKPPIFVHWIMSRPNLQLRSYILMLRTCNLVWKPREICMEMTQEAHSKAPIFVWKRGGWLVKQSQLFRRHQTWFWRK